MVEIGSFLLTAVGISLSGVMAPGPVTAATVAAGTRSPHAGALIAVGHGIVEFPLMLLILAGMDRLLASAGMKVGIGLAGGVVLLLMGGLLIRSLGIAAGDVEKYTSRSPVWIGIVVTGGNPYFLLWWATVGLALASRAIEFGALVFVVFALAHWSCDLLWLEVLSVTGHKGARVMGPGAQRVVTIACSVALMAFGVKFIYDAARAWAA
jgi:threonine/homoserine/homoserine lactone efflux protein